VGKYMLRPVLALERLTFLEPEGKVGYRWGRGGERQGTEMMDYLKFIARVTSHIPDKGQVTVRYYGLYANAHRGKVRKASLSPTASVCTHGDRRCLHECFAAPNRRGGAPPSPRQRLGGPDSEASCRTAQRCHDPQSLRGRPDALS
jgi:hypothetical protein